MTQYRFGATWVLQGTSSRDAWEVIKSYNYQYWWNGVTVNLLGLGDEGPGIGEFRELVLETQIPYRLKLKNYITRLEFPSLIEIDVYGELEGVGRCEITQFGDQTEILHSWEVRTTRPWMNLIAPVMRPIIARNHEWMMHQGAIGLADYLNAKLMKG